MAHQPHIEHGAKRLPAGDDARLLPLISEHGRRHALSLDGRNQRMQASSTALSLGLLTAAAWRPVSQPGDEAAAGPPSAHVRAKSLEEAGEENAHDAIEHALAEAGELAANAGHVSIREVGAASRQRRQCDDGLAFAEAKAALGTARKPQCASAQFGRTTASRTS